jgi:hypothetical protein
VDAARKRIAPGETVALDVYLTSAEDLRTYEIAIDIMGSKQGGLTVENLKIDASRADFAFGTSTAVTARDPIKYRLGGTLISGRVEVDRAYLGTFQLRASPLGRGTFNVNVTGVLLGDSDNNRIDFAVGPDSVLTVDSPTRHVER